MLLHITAYCQLEIAMLWWLFQTQPPSSFLCQPCDWSLHFWENQLSPSVVWLKRGVVLWLGVVGCYLFYKYRAGIGDYQYLITSIFTVSPNNRVFFPFRFILSSFSITGIGSRGRASLFKRSKLSTLQPMVPWGHQTSQSRLLGS